jgi:hypothetical protein
MNSSPPSMRLIIFVDHACVVEFTPIFLSLDFYAIK